MASIFFGLLSVLSLAIFILLLVCKDKLDDADGDILPALVIFSICSFISFTIASVATYESNEGMYSKCMKNVNKEEYCIKYLKD